MDLHLIRKQPVNFHTGLPKICVPLVEEGSPALLHEALRVRALPADLFEWRADHFFGSFALGLSTLREADLRKPLLCTLRTKGEGGKADLTPEAYEEKLWTLLRLDGYELIDIELSAGEERVGRLTKAAHEKGLLVILSMHDFEKTPSEAALFSTMEKMHALGADLPKVAVTPQTPRDVLTLLSATERAYQAFGPVATMSMGELGKVTRVAGAVFGSALTFGAGVSASAPGQIGAEDLRAILEDVSPRV